MRTTATALARRAATPLSADFECAFGPRFPLCFSGARAAPRAPRHRARAPLGLLPSRPHPPYSAQATNALALVAFGPPPGRVELIPDCPPGADAWSDGEWILGHGRWSWLVGRWVKAPADWTYSPWVVVRAADGTCFYAPSVWKDARGNVVPGPSPLAFAHPSAQGIDHAENELERTGRNLLTAPSSPSSLGSTAPPDTQRPPESDSSEQDAEAPSLREPTRDW